MRRPFGWMRGALASAALAIAGAVAAWAATPVADGWTADPDEQFILDVNLRQLMLGDGVRAYRTPQGTCVVFGDFLTAIDVPMKLDLQAQKAEGWAFREENRIAIDKARSTVSYGKHQETIPATVIRDTPEGWCVDSESLSKWFGIGVKPTLSGSILRLDSNDKLPVELAIERQKRAAQLAKKAALPVEKLPKVKLPYRMWRTPMVDVVVSAGVTYDAHSGTRIDRSAAIYASGELAKMSYTASIATDNKGRPTTARFMAYRSDPDGGLLGPLKATHFGVGDVQGVASRLLPYASGRGVEVTNRPLINPIAFDRTRFEGDLPAGWDAELYRNGMLLAFSSDDGSGRYNFENVELPYGDNRFEIILYGPQGQTKSRIETINVADAQVPKGETWYAASISQPGKALISKRYNDDIDNSLQQYNRLVPLPDLQAVVNVEHGLTKSTSVGVLAAMMLKDDERVTFVEGSIRQTVGPMVVEAAASYDTNGGKAARVQALGRIGAINVSAEGLVANDFVIEQRREVKYREGRLAIDAPFIVGTRPFLAHGDVRYRERTDTRELQANGRLSANLNGLNLTGAASLTKQLPRPGQSVIPSQFDLGLIASGRIRKVRLRGEAEFEVSPQSRLRTAMLSAYWSGSENADWEAAIGYDAQSPRAVARLSHIRRFKSFALAASVEAGSDHSFAAGINLNFSLDPTPYGVRFTNKRLTNAGTISARVYRDLNDNGRRDGNEPFEKDVLVTTGTQVAEEGTDKYGMVRVHGLAINRPVTVGIDSTTLADPNLAPRKALQLVVPRAGIATQVDIPLVGSGDIEAVLVKQDGRGFEGVELELLDASGGVVATTQTDYDGFILFERVPFGQYRMRIAAASAAAAKLSPTLDRQVTIDPDHTVVRLGAIRPQRTDVIAAADAATPMLH